MRIFPANWWTAINTPAVTIACDSRASLMSGKARSSLEKPTRGLGFGLKCVPRTCTRRALVVLHMRPSIPKVQTCASSRWGTSASLEPSAVKPGVAAIFESRRA